MKPERREAMMMRMMPAMMDGLEIEKLMPKMMGAMLQDLSAEDVVTFLREALRDKQRLVQVLDALRQTQPMAKMMFKVYKSQMGFEETVTTISEEALKHGWEVPQVRDLQKTYVAAGLEDMTRLKILYFCNPQGGYAILQDDASKPMSVMMPMGVSVYERGDGQVEVAAMNLGLMSGMFSGTIQEVLRDGAARLEQSLARVTQLPPS
jgi:uncharacterized protein (DUF302 family)